MSTRLVVLLGAFAAFIGVALPAASIARSEHAATFSLTSTQAEEVSAVVEFNRAFNTQRLSDGLRIFAPDASVSDCDYKRMRGVEFRGQRDVAHWLRERFADHDHLIIKEIRNENELQPVGVVVVEYVRRANDTLRALGFSAGIVPPIAAKVVFGIGYKVGRAVRIKAFALGPGQGNPVICRPR